MTVLNKRSSTRTYWLITVQLVVGTAGLGACCGYLLDGPLMSAATAVVAGAGAGAGSFLARRRVFAHVEKGHDDAASRGYSEGLAHAVLVGIATYEAAVFPVVPGGVLEEERTARRTVAYRIAAWDGLPHLVRATAAAALEAIDQGEDAARARGAMKELAATVYRQRTPL